MIRDGNWCRLLRQVRPIHKVVTFTQYGSCRGNASRLSTLALRRLSHVPLRRDFNEMASSL
jgi:hypothetical protein